MLVEAMVAEDRFASQIPGTPDNSERLLQSPCGDKPEDGNECP